MWYVKLNGNILPTPYQRFEDCMEEVRRLQNTMVAVCVDAVLI